MAYQYLNCFEETVEERAERPDAVIQLERRFILAEISCEFTPQQVEVGHVTPQLSQLLGRCLQCMPYNCLWQLLTNVSPRWIETYCLPSLLFGCEIWNLTAHSIHKLNVAWITVFQVHFPWFLAGKCQSITVLLFLIACFVHYWSTPNTFLETYVMLRQSSSTFHESFCVISYLVPFSGYVC